MHRTNPRTDPWTMSAMPIPRRARLGRWFAAWLILTCVASLLTIGPWSGGVDGRVRIAGNTAWVLALPGWVPLYTVGLRGLRSDPVWITTANGLAWLVWLLGLRVVLAVRSRVARPRTPTIDPGRRAFLANSAAGALGAGFVGGPAYGTVVEPWDLRVRRYEIPLRDLPAGLEGMSILHYSDPHLGPRIPASYIRRSVEIGLDLRPDLVVLTGDYITHDMSDIGPVADLMAAFVHQAPVGVVGVLGNHDWYGDGVAMQAALDRVGVRMLRNQRLWLDGQRRWSHSPLPNSLVFAGLADLSEDRVDVRAALGGLEDGVPRIVLAHQPDTAEIPELAGPDGPRVDLMLSGHTHGGQVRIPFLGTPGIPSNYGQKYAGGLIAGPRFPVLVSRGVGMSVLPVRVGVPPEIGLITLRRG